MNIKFTDSAGMTYRFEVVEQVPQLEVGNPDSKHKVLRVHFYSKNCDGVANHTLKNGLGDLSWLSQEANNFITKVWKNKAFL
jgi:hypothetical protein